MLSCFVSYIFYTSAPYTVCQRSYYTNIFNKNFIEFVSQYVLLQKTVLQSLLFEYFSKVIIIVQTAVVTRTSRLIQCTYNYIVFLSFAILLVIQRW